MQHSDVVGGSTCGRLINCPGSRQLIKQVPRQEGSDYASEGTMLHHVMEEVVLNDVSPAKMIGYQWDDHTLTKNHLADFVQPALQQFNDVCDEYGIEEFDCEQMVTWDAKIPGAFGSVDVIGKGKTHNLILDWKGGAGVPVQIEGNTQLRFYAAGAMMTSDLADLFDPALPTVLCVVQPRVFDEPQIEVINTLQLEHFIALVTKAVRASEQPDAEIKAGSHCRFCPAKPICPVKTGAAEQIDTAQTFDIKELGPLLDLAADMEDWARSVRALALQSLEHGQAVPGYKLVAKRATRKWIDEEVAETRLRRLKFRVAEIRESKLKSPAQIEKLLKLKGRQGVLEPLVEKKSGGLTIAPDSDKRPAVPAVGASLKLLAEKVS